MARCCWKSPTTLASLPKVLIFWTFLVNVCLSLRPNSGVSDPWGENQRPKQYTDYLTQHSDSAYRFFGNQTHTDYFKLLRKDGQSLLIGARNVIYNISLPFLTENLDQRITWDPLDEDRELCLLKGKTEVDCQNYIRILAKTGDDSLLVCGTNAYNPKCRNYSRHIQSSYYEPMMVDKEYSGRGFCPYDPRHNSTYLFTDGELYSGTVADFSASDSLIIKDSLRTEQYDFKQLNAPDFVNALEDERHVYFFFREDAVEHINCGKTSFSRIARVCKNDQGGPHKFKNKWTTFLKTRLNCSVPGDTPFYFNDIQATTNFIKDGKDQVVYGVFTTPDNSIAGSAICAFKLSEITDSFEEGPFKNQETVNSNWLPMSKSQIPEPRPGICASDPQDMSENSLNFIKRHSLMDWSVGSATRTPIFVKTSLGERLTVIEADPGVRSVEGTVTDVLFAGTTNGRVLKVSANTNTLIEAFQVFPYHVPVRNLLVAGEQIIVLSDHEVNAFPLQRCSSALTCGDCVALQDPYCAWSLETSECAHQTHSSYARTRSGMIQDLEHGYHSECPIPVPETSTLPPTTTTSTTTTTTSTATTASETSEQLFENKTTDSKGKVTVNSPISGGVDGSDEACPTCKCDCDTAPNSYNNNDLLMQPTSTESPLASLFPTIVPSSDFESGGEYGNLDPTAAVPKTRRIEELKKSVFVAPYTNGYEPANSSPHYKESRAQNSYSEQTLALSIVLTALLALVVGFSLGLLASRSCCRQQKQLHLAFYDKTLNFTNRAAGVMRGVSQRCSFQKPTRAHNSASSTASSSSGSGSSPPSSVHMGQLDSGYTSPSNLTNASVNTQETSASSSASSTASTPSASPNTTVQPQQLGHPQPGGLNLLVNVPPKSETLKMGGHFTTMPRHNFPTHQRSASNSNMLMMTAPVVPASAQVAVLSNAGGTLQKVKRVYL